MGINYPGCLMNFHWGQLNSNFFVMSLQCLLNVDVEMKNGMSITVTTYTGIHLKIQRR